MDCKMLVEVCSTGLPQYHNELCRKQTLLAVHSSCSRPLKFWYCLSKYPHLKIVCHTSSLAVPPLACPKNCPPSPGRKFKNRLFSHGEDDIGGRLLPGECLVSDNGKHSFCFESDGNVVVYSQEKPVWKSNSTAQQPTELFIDNEDGQLVAKEVDAAEASLGGSDFWLNIPNEQTIKSGAPFTAIMDNDGNFVIKRGDDAVIWSTNTTEPGKDKKHSPPGYMHAVVPDCKVSQ